MSLSLTPQSIASYIQAGCGYSCSVAITSATNPNVKMGLEVFANNIAADVFIYRSLANGGISSASQVLFNQHNALDATLTASPTVFNQNPAISATPLATVKASPALNTSTTTITGTSRYTQLLQNATNGIELFQNISGIFIPAGSVFAGIVSANAPTAGNTIYLIMEWLEF